MIVKFEKEATDGAASGAFFDSLNTTGGHMFVCLIIAAFGMTLMWMGRSEPAIFAIGIGLLQAGIGVIFRSMGIPNPVSTTPKVVHVTNNANEKALAPSDVEAIMKEVAAKMEAEVAAVPQRS